MIYEGVGKKEKKWQKLQNKHGIKNANLSFFAYLKTCFIEVLLSNISQTCLMLCNLFSISFKLSVNRLWNMKHSSLSLKLEMPDKSRRNCSWKMSKLTFYWKCKINIRTKCTMWKFNNFSIFQSLCEINFWASRSAKSAVSTHLEALNFDL